MTRRPVPWFWIIFVAFFALLAVVVVNVAIGIGDSQPRPIEWGPEE